MKVAYRRIHLAPKNRQRLAEINTIIDEYRKQGYTLTLRQLYYQLVSRDIIPNQQKEYAKLSRLLGEGRMAGIVDWSAIEDRLRSLEKPGYWDSPLEILQMAARQFRRNNQEGQSNRIEVWVEKDALSGVLSRVTQKYGIGIQVNRGYGSITALRDAFERFLYSTVQGKCEKFYILYLGDHDPSGLDMIRDIEARIFEFWYGVTQNFHEEPCPKDFKESYEYEQFSKIFEIVPVALTASQIAQYNPPPNPAKMADPRSGKYVDEHGKTSYEVDALKPEVLNQILTDAITDRIDLDKYRLSLGRQSIERTAAIRAVDSIDLDDYKSDEEE